MDYGGYATEEVLELCTNYKDLKPMGVSVSRHEGWLLGKGILGHRVTSFPELKTIKQAHFIVLQQSALASRYVGMHNNILHKENPSR